MIFKVEFRKSGGTFEWDESSANLLDFAEAKGIEIESNCRLGVCGACKVKLISGKVFMDTEEGLEKGEKEKSMILPCVSIPQTNLVIEA